MKRFPSIHLAIGILTSVLIAGCGGSSGTGSGTIVNPAPVQAQSGYSSASLNGTYTITMITGTVGNAAPPVSFIGTLVFDGNGNITSGNITEAAGTFSSTTAQGTTTNCPLTATGTYTLGSNATGTAALTLAGASVSASATNIGGNVNGCFPVSAQVALSIGGAQQGQTFVFQSAAGATSLNFSGSGFKQ